MKKVAFLCCLFCGLITQAVGATYNCKPQYIGDRASKRNRNEYLFLGDSNYDNGLALVCGHKGTDGCKHGTMVMVAGVFYHEGARAFERILYKCDTKGGSSWLWVGEGDINKCSGQDGVYLSPHWDDGFAIYGVGVGKSVQYEGGRYVYWDEMCYDEVKETDTEKVSETTSGQDIGSSDTSGTDVSGTGATGTGTSGAGTSAQKQSSGAEENEEDKWREPCSKEDLLKVPHAKEGRYIYKTKNELVCAATACEAGYYLVRNAEGKSQGWCKYGTDPYATTNASETTSEQGASSSDASGTGTGTSGAGTSTQKQSIDTGTSLTQSQTSRVRALAQKIESAASQLDSMSSRFKVSVWKDAEGKFNTARLASDSIAGVVLGTAGGLITSHVVKKNQVENGFQDIKCTIGGQSVANWGDEFSVGIQ